MWFTLWVCDTAWKIENFTLFCKIFREHNFQSDFIEEKLISRVCCKEVVRENPCNFHTVWSNMNLRSFPCIFTFFRWKSSKYCLIKVRANKALLFEFFLCCRHILTTFLLRLNFISVKFIYPVPGITKIFLFFAVQVPRQILSFW